MEDRGFSVEIVRRERFQFDVDFGAADWPHVRVDEPPPLGDGQGPNAARLLAAAVGNCLAASLLFCLDKARIELKELSAHVEGAYERNAAGRMRISELSVTLVPTVAGEVPARMSRCLEVFEDFCVVTQSVREGIDVQVAVEPAPSGADASAPAELAAREG